jgi:hypothetical protein
MRIFNRVFEIPDSAQNAENLTEMGQFETQDPAFTIPALTIVAPYAKGTAR